LELANYYKWFAKDFAKAVKLFDEMTKKDIKWNWKEKQQRAFKKLKERFIIKLVLVIPDLNKKIRVEADVFDFATEGMLLMKCENCYNYKTLELVK